jgi:hypothetical protein
MPSKSPLATSSVLAAALLSSFSSQGGIVLVPVECEGCTANAAGEGNSGPALPYEPYVHVITTGTSGTCVQYTDQSGNLVVDCSALINCEIAVDRFWDGLPGSTPTFTLWLPNGRDFDREPDLNILQTLAGTGGDITTFGGTETPALLHCGSGELTFGISFGTASATSTGSCDACDS